jgi:hypothetical protein
MEDEITARLMQKYEAKLNANIPLTPEEQAVYMANMLRKHNVEDEIVKRVVPSKLHTILDQLTMDVEVFILAAAIGFGISRIIR